MNIIGVKDLNKKIEVILTTQKDLKNIKVEGEISGFKINGKHAYFKIKEGEYTLNCVLFWYTSKNMKFIPKDGMKVICIGDISTYYKNGRSDYQLKCVDIEEHGEGRCRREYEELMAKLKKEGLFDVKRKKKIPKYPKKVGLATAYNSHAYNDLCKVGKSRYPGVKFIISNCRVQGKEAPKSIVQALDILENDNNVEVIILARGGGSLEDLHCFNDEYLARYIASMKTPVITGIGHQQDTTIADLVSDLQASTPTDAVNSAVISKQDEKKELSNMHNNILHNYTNMIYATRKNNDSIIEYINLINLENIILDNKKMVNCEVKNLLLSLESKIINEKQKIKKEKDTINNLNLKSIIHNNKSNICFLSNKLNDNLTFLFKDKYKSLGALDMTHIQNNMLNRIFNNKIQIKDISDNVQDNIQDRLCSLKKYISSNMNISTLSENIINMHTSNLKTLTLENNISNLKNKFEDLKIKNDNLNVEIDNCFENRVSRKRKENADLLDFIINLGPDKILKRGYSVILNTNGDIIADSKSLIDGIFEIKFADETIKVSIQKIN